MLRVGGGQQQMSPQDFSMEQQPQDMPMDGMPQTDPQMMGGDPMQGAGEMPPMDDMSQDNSQSQFDTNFDAGVEADEDTDPKKFIQQLTGKLSTTLNSFNTENQDDGLNKYVAKMIVKASTKNMDDADKKEIIKAINTSSEDEPIDNEGGETEDSVDNNVEVTDDVQVDDTQMMEGLISKRELKKIAEAMKRRLRK